MYMLSPSRRPSNTQAGFTIVELLIVIVVIAILAAITMVSFSGIQEKARNVSRISDARTAMNLIKMYVAGEGDYPFKLGGGRCVGTGFPDDKCWGIDSPSPGVVNATLNAELAKYGSGPNVSTPPVMVSDWQGPWRGMGPVYHYSSIRTVDGEPSPVVVVYFLEGENVDCGNNAIRPTDPSVNWSTTVADNTLVTQEPRFTITGPNGYGTHCVVPVV